MNIKLSLLLSSLLLFTACQDETSSLKDVDTGAVYTLDDTRIVLPVSEVTFESLSEENLVKLDGSSSTTMLQGELSYRWEILSKPKKFKSYFIG